MTRLRDHLASLIAAEGPLSIAEFMRSVAAAYYEKGDPFGAAGDFTTAPEISQVFGELLGAWSVAVWELLGSPSRFSFVELGPGRGTLMRDALRAARVRPAFLAAADVLLVELSQTLREKQRDALKDAPVRTLQWLEAFHAPRGQPLIVLANEFFDALPIRQYVATEQGWRERCVGFDGDEFVFSLSPTVMPRDLTPITLEQVSERAVVELSPARDALAETIAEQLVIETGGALAIDYGFLGPAVGDTLQAMRGHRFESVLADPGHADVTSHVDFAALATGFARGGAEVYGPLAQGAFLQRLGGRERMEALSSGATAAQREGLEAGFARLTADDQMGSLFQVLAAASPGLLPPGFSSYERF
ncbi:MAG: class I SAM-dependent methyltransferase [Alphaproteobacteria bacterium]|nr:class I SAM-dependent methyltransferase [Alphaproteobacteria bacterium]